jgi:hypothetical protein
MNENTFLIILGILLGALQLGIGAFLMSLLRRMDAVEKDNVSIKTNYQNKFTEVHKKLGETEVSIIKEFNSGLTLLSDRFANAIDRLTNKIEKISEKK